MKSIIKLNILLQETLDNIVSFYMYLNTECMHKGLNHVDLGYEVQTLYIIYV